MTVEAAASAILASAWLIRRATSGVATMTTMMSLTTNPDALGGHFDHVA